MGLLRHDVLEAKQKELKKWIDLDVHEEVEDKGQKGYLSYMGDNRKKLQIGSRLLRLDWLLVDMKRKLKIY